MNLKIRKPEESDISEMFLIAMESFSLPWSINTFIDEIKNPHSILKVAELEGNLTGYAVLRVILDEAELLSIAVKPKFRKLGIATALLKQTLEELKNVVKACYLEVRQSNQPAINLYKNLGFRFCGVRKNYYILPQEDAYMMRLDLKEYFNQEL